MSSPSNILHTPTPAAAPDLLSLRAELDRLDDALHDTLMRRAEVVQKVAALRVKGSVPLRPGREAAIIRRLLARHSGGMPAFGIVRIWRELLATTTAQQRPLLVAVCQPDGELGYLAAAREHLGALTPVRAYATPVQAIGELRAGIATVAVLPLPAEGEAPAAAWWTALLHADDARVHVVGRLPFWAPRPEGSPKLQALLVSTAAPDPSGQDRSLLGLELPPELGRARLDAAVAAAGFQAGTMILLQDPGAAVAHALVDVDGFVGDDDARLTALQPVLRPPMVLGAYAEPLSGEA
jgi:chorismate mutase